MRYLCAVGGCSSRETSRVDGGPSFIKKYARLDSQSDTLTRETTQSPSASCGESSSKSVSSQASLKSQACPVPVSPVESHMISEVHPTCAAGNAVHSRSSTRTRIEVHERIVTTTPYKYEDDKIVNKFAEILRRLPWRSWPSQTLETIVPFSTPRLQEQL